MANVKKEEPKQLWVYMKSGNQLEIYLKKGEKTLSRKFIPKTEEPGWDFQTFHRYIARLQKSSSNLEEVFILPTADILYENIIKVMDKLRQEKLLSIGLTPL